ncbi:uncharacterized protein DS421_3g74100 [Arachis hypogaea]|nr:uncharacterized protein DS421_3g74100 [Arachis hypogaea]
MNTMEYPQEDTTCQRIYSTIDLTFVLLLIHQMLIFSPCSRAMEAERIRRLRFKTVNADSHSEIILVTEEGSSDVSEDPKARAACESLRFPKLEKNCYK